MADETNADANVKGVEFDEVAPGAKASANANLDLVRDIEVQLSVELGRAEMPIQDILELAPGRVIELDKLAGQALDVLAGGRLIARGEVVLVDDKFGVRITAILDQAGREAAVKG
jgi:flagellar motor switch protein FliN/FliY